MGLKIYTRTGDTGETSLFGGKRVLKSSLRVHAYGTVDELNSMIGVAIAEIQNSPLRSSSFAGQAKFQIQNHKAKIKNELGKIQHDLLLIGSTLASPHTKYHIQITTYFLQRVEECEHFIDDLTKELPELRNFILPGGEKKGALLHMARTVCRRAERLVVELAHKESVPPEIITYINRLSDLLFTMARFVNYHENQIETKWVKPV